MRKFTVIKNEQITSGVICLTLRKTDARPFSFTAGQYAAISFYRHGRPTPARCFSIASSPVDPDIIKFGIRVGGKYTRAIQKLQENDIVDVRGPFGNFTVSPEQHKIVMLAGGIGITPFLSIISNLTERNISTPVKLLYSCRTDNDIAFAQELIELQNKNPNFALKFVISQELTGIIDPELTTAGTINADLITESINNDYQNTSFFMCGPPGFMIGMNKILVKKNVQPDQIISEAFNQVSNGRTEATRNWPKSIYFFTALGLAMGSITVMTLDLLKTLPPKDIAEEIKGVENSPITNLRQNDIDKLVNELPSVANPAPISAGSIVSAETAKNNALVTQAKDTSPTTSASTIKTNNPVTSAPSATAPQAAPVQTPAPTPKPVTCGSKC